MREKLLLAEEAGVDEAGDIYLKLVRSVSCVNTKSHLKGSEAVHYNF